MVRNVLVVEDDPELNELVGAYVQMIGFQYHRALTGQAALAQVQARPFALILLDFMLPDMDGFQVCRELKAAPAGATAPVVFLTAMHDLKSRQGWSECGAAACLTKPFNPALLMSTVSSHALPA